jgi:hypothetical protein
MSEYLPVGVSPHPTSSALTPAASLDPELFDGERMKSDVRIGILSTIHGFLGQHFQNSEKWLQTWLTGSGASYRWHAALDLRDLDVLLGIDFINFKKSNPGFSGIGNAELAQHINGLLRASLWPTTARWRDQYELTFYVLRDPDILAINPYAAYGLDQDEWLVRPDQGTRTAPEQWDLYADMYRERAERAVIDYSKTLTELQAATNPAHRINAEARFKYAVSNASSLYESVHARRGVGFSSTGEGYNDFGNFLWQRGKAAGWLPALRQIHDYRRVMETSQAVNTYGVELPTADLLVQRAAMRYGMD